MRLLNCHPTSLTIRSKGFRHNIRLVSKLLCKKGRSMWVDLQLGHQTVIMWSIPDAHVFTCFYVIRASRFKEFNGVGVRYHSPDCEVCFWIADVRPAFAQQSAEKFGPATLRGESGFQDFNKAVITGHIWWVPWCLQGKWLRILSQIVAEINCDRSLVPTASLGFFFSRDTSLPHPPKEDASQV